MPYENTFMFRIISRNRIYDFMRNYNTQQKYQGSIWVVISVNNYLIDWHGKLFVCKVKTVIIISNEKKNWIKMFHWHDCWWMLSTVTGYYLYIVIVNPSIKINYIVHGFFRIKAIELISVFIGVV